MLWRSCSVCCLMQQFPLNILFIQVMIAFFIVVMGLWSTFGNLLTILAIAFHTDMQTKCNAFLLSLATSDLLSGLVASPLWLYRRCDWLNCVLLKFSCHNSACAVVLRSVTLLTACGHEAKCYQYNHFRQFLNTGFNRKLGFSKYAFRWWEVLNACIKGCGRFGRRVFHWVVDHKSFIQWKHDKSQKVFVSRIFALLACSNRLWWSYFTRIKFNRPKLHSESSY